VPALVVIVILPSFIFEFSTSAYVQPNMVKRSTIPGML
jgi:hypothetical protein